MDLDPQADLTKDKRMLVLLAFGALFLLPHVPVVLPDIRAEEVTWGWREEPGEKTTLFRVRLPSAREEEPAGTVAAAVSPRLALLLGKPLPINRATREELILLDGIGPKLAAAIADYRDRHGRIVDERALREVPGIGERLGARIAPQLSFE